MAYRAEDRVPSRETCHGPEIDQLEQELLEAAQRNEHANDELRRYLAEHRGSARAVVDRLLGGEHPWQVLMREQAASRRESYLEVWREFEETRQQMRRLVILWAKRRFGVWASPETVEAFGLVMQHDICAHSSTTRVV